MIQSDFIYLFVPNLDNLNMRPVRKIIADNIRKLNEDFGSTITVSFTVKYPI